MKPSYVVRCANPQCRKAVEPETEYGQDFLIFCSANCAQRKSRKNEFPVAEQKRLASALPASPLDRSYAHGRISLMLNAQDSLTGGSPQDDSSAVLSGSDSHAVKVA